MAHLAERLRGALRRPSRGDRALLATAALGLAALWWMAPPGDAAPAGPSAEQSLVVSRQPFVASIGFTGTIVPGDDIGITAPFDGTVKAVGFLYGDRVAPGQMLVELETSELEQSRNEAESAYLKAAQTAAEMRDWANGPEVSRARRAAATAAFDLRETERKLQETKALLDRGLVARSEYDGIVQQQRTQQMSAAAADEDLRAAFRRGEGANRRVAALELENARARLARLDAASDAAVVRAPDSGIIVRPPSEKTELAESGIHVGGRLSKGQLIGSIARAGGLAVAFRLDEADVNRIRIGQPVSVTGPGFGGVALNGKIFSIAGEAGTAVGGVKASFAATVRLDPLTPEQAQQVRIGMSASIAVITYTNPHALVVPPQAVQGAAPAVTVTVRDRSGRKRAAAVQIGQVAPDGVEILSGLKAGETVIWTVPVAEPVPQP